MEGVVAEFCQAQVWLAHSKRWIQWEACWDVHHGDAAWKREIWPRNDPRVMIWRRMMSALGMKVGNLQGNIEKIENVGGRGRTPDLPHTTPYDPSFLPLGRLVICYTK